MPGGALAGLVVLPLLAAGLSGCMVLDDLLGQAPAFEEVVKLDREFSFKATGLPSPTVPPGVAQRLELPFVVPNGTRSLRVDVAVRFVPPGAPASPLPEPPELPVPPLPPVVEPPTAGLPEGRVTANVTGPTGPRAELLFNQTTAESFLEDLPAAGGWSLVVEAYGEGVVRIHVVAVEPRAR